MLIILSPSKTLDFSPQEKTEAYTTPRLLKESRTLVKRLREFSPEELSRLMSISPRLAEENVERFAQWKTPFKPSNAKQAILAFRGDVYSGLDADSLSPKALEFAQDHLRILSGLYGVLRALDLIQPYRLEMSTKLSTSRGKDLYAFWGTKITDVLNADLAGQRRKVLVNLASNEYFKAVKTERLDARLITPVFKERKGGGYKTIAIFAKKARGMMARYAIKRQIKDANKLKGFDEAGYAFNGELSSDNEWVFTREST